MSEPDSSDRIYVRYLSGSPLINRFTVSGEMYRYLKRRGAVRFEDAPVAGATFPDAIIKSCA